MLVVFVVATDGCKQLHLPTKHFIYLKDSWCDVDNLSKLERIAVHKYYIHYETMRCFLLLG